MGHRQKMTGKQRLDWDSNQYAAKLKYQKGHNYEYWNEGHAKMLENGWSLFTFDGKEGTAIRDRKTTSIEEVAKEMVEQLRLDGFFARIVCGYDKNVQKIKMFSVIYKPKKTEV